MKEAVSLPTQAVLRICESAEIERFINDCHEVLRNRGDMVPYLESDDLAVIDATCFILEQADDIDLEEIYFLIEDELCERGIFDETE